ncbi:MAG TPA: helix-turn-helix transcriptional regulator [Blastocatellia bacterium]
MRERETDLSRFVRERLSELHVRQTEFCRQTGFDQGLLSKIQTGTVHTFSLESGLKLAVGLKVSPKTLLDLIKRPDLNELVLEAYGITEKSEERPAAPSEETPEDVRSMVDRAMAMGKDLAPVREALSRVIENKSETRCAGGGVLPSIVLV